MSRRTKITIAVILLIIFLIALILGIWVWIKSLRTVPTSPPPAVPQVQAPVEPPTPLGQVPPAEAPQSAVEASLETFARSFAERYGSYSNQSNFENIEDLLAFMTNGLRNQSQSYIDKIRATGFPNSASYQGITTKVLSVQKQSTNGEAALLVKTQRQESGADPTASKVYYQDLLLSIVKQGGVWKVAKAEWK